MSEISWFAFYLLLHLLLSLALLPLMLWLRRQAGRRHYEPCTMLRCWYFFAALIMVSPAVMLQPWAMDAQLLPWFHQGLQQATGTPWHAGAPEPLQMPLADPIRVQQLDWPVASQLIHWLTPTVWLWLLLPAVCVLKCLRLLLSYLAARSLRAGARPVLLSGLACPLPVKSHPALHSAMLVGIRRPEILVPTLYLQHLSQVQLEVVLAHEVCHQQQGDLRSYLLQQLAGALFWWSPGWRLISAELSRWRELRCDALVSAAMQNPQRYAQTLLDCALLSQNQSFSVLAQRWWQQPLLPQRVDALLSQSRRPQRWGYPAMLVLMLALAGTCWLAHQWQLADLPARHANIRLSDLAPLRQLLDAVRQQDLQRVRTLLAQGAPLNIAQPGEGSALMVAVRRQQPAMVGLLLAAGADPNVSSRGDGNALIIAAQHGDLALAQLLLAAGADVNAAVLADETALINASMRGDIAMAQLLLEQGALINLQVRTPLSDGRVWRSALNQAATAAMRDFLLARGAR